MATSLRQRIERLAAQWRPLLGLEAWDIQLRFDEKTHQATCTAKPVYQEATLTFNLHRIRKEIRTPAALEELVVHELVHCIIWKSSERAVTQIGKALLRVRGV